MRVRGLTRWGSRRHCCELSGRRRGRAVVGDGRRKPRCNAARRTGACSGCNVVTAVMAANAAIQHLVSQLSSRSVVWAATCVSSRGFSPCQPAEDRSCRRYPLAYGVFVDKLSRRGLRATLRILDPAPATHVKIFLCSIFARQVLRQLLGGLLLVTMARPVSLSAMGADRFSASILLPTGERLLEMQGKTVIVNIVLLSKVCWSERRDLNSGPPVPQTGALTGLRYAP